MSEPAPPGRRGERVVAWSVWTVLLVVDAALVASTLVAHRVLSDRCLNPLDPTFTICQPEQRELVTTASVVLVVVLAVVTLGSLAVMLTVRRRLLPWLWPAGALVAVLIAAVVWLATAFAVTP